jgi:hypothetical protein
MTSELPRFVRDMLASCPTAGQGVNSWLYRTARYLHFFYQSDTDGIVRLLEAACHGCGRNVSRVEIERAVANSKDCAWSPSQDNATKVYRTSKWPEPDSKLIESICAYGRGLADLWEESNRRFEDNDQHTEEIIDRMFPGNPLLCCGQSDREFDTRTREEWRGELSRLQLIVPNPMTARRGATQEGKQSAHALSITGPRKYLVVELDFSIYARDGKTETIYAPLIRRLNVEGFEVADMGAAMLLHLASKGPMLLALHSGGKSMHGWFRAEGVREETLLKFMRYAAIIGADPATWSRSQFVRMPDGPRHNGKRQTVYFQNFGLMEGKR